MTYASNEELLREGECPSSNCIEVAGHSGPHFPGQAKGQVDIAVSGAIRRKDLALMKLVLEALEKLVLSSGSHVYLYDEEGEIIGCTGCDPIKEAKKAIVELRERLLSE